jgi:hypothetical protein
MSRFDGLYKEVIFDCGLDPIRSASSIQQDGDVADQPPSNSELVFGRTIFILYDVSTRRVERR